MPRADHDHGAGPSQRQLRVAELLRRGLSDVLLRGDLHEPDLAGRSVTVGEVRMSPDLKLATVFVSELGGGDPLPIVKALARNKGEIRRVLTKSVRLKYSPDLRFLADESYDRMDATRALLARDEVARDLQGGAEGERRGGHDDGDDARGRDRGGWD